MPVESPDLEAAAKHYALTLGAIAGSPPVLDLVHLGLGPDGHTASLVPGDPALDVIDSDVAPTGVYQGRRRMTLTYPILNRSRRILWLVTGSEKGEMLGRCAPATSRFRPGRFARSRPWCLPTARRRHCRERTEMGGRTMGVGVASWLRRAWLGPRTTNRRKLNTPRELES